MCPLLVRGTQRKREPGERDRSIIAPRQMPALWREGAARLTVAATHEQVALDRVHRAVLTASERLWSV